MRRTLMTLGLAALAFAIAAPAVFANSPDDTRRGKRGDRGAFMIKKLNLTPDQATALTALKTEQRADVMALRQELRAKKQELRAQWTSGQPDRSAVLALTGEINALQAQMAVDRVDFLFAAQGLLTAEQFEALLKMETRGGKHGKRFHKRGQRGKDGFRGKRGGFGRGGEPTPTE